MKPKKRLAAHLGTALLGLLVAGCGQKGPLTLPQPAPQPEMNPAVERSATSSASSAASSEED